MNTINTSIFLKEGAFLRWQGSWYLFLGPFQFAEKSKNHEISITCQHFFGGSKTTLVPQKLIRLDDSTWKNTFKSEQRSNCRVWHGPSREEYSRSFQKVKQKFTRCEWKKAVPIAFDYSDGSLAEFEMRNLLARVAEAPDSLIPYGFWKDEKGFIGLTPETLFSIEGTSLQTMALAGTEKKNGQPSTLLDDAKNLKEHNFVADELSEKLLRFGEVSKQGPQILELPTLYHLQTQFSVSLKNHFKAEDAVHYLHPTSALGISPYSKWRELADLPNQKQRGYFGAPVLFDLSENHQVALVALRQVQWNQDQIFIGAGGGVVQESQEELEWQEILAKIESVKKLLGIE